MIVCAFRLFEEYQYRVSEGCVQSGVDQYGIVIFDFD